MADDGAVVSAENAGFSEDAGLIDEPIAEKISLLVNGVIQQTQTAMEDLLLEIAKINSSYMEVMEEMQQARDYVLARKSKLEEEREKFQQAACSILQMLGALAGSES